MDTIFENNSYKILKLFMNNSNKDFSIRGIARILNISHATVINHIKDLRKLKLIKKKDETLYPTYYASGSEKFKHYKKNQIIFDIYESGIIDYIQKKCWPSSIILFGSCAKGEYHKNSDIDIFIEAEEIRMDCKSFEKKLQKDINLLFEPKIDDLSSGLKNNIINGKILYGFIKIKNEMEGVS